jgi:hypothetical protein
MTEYWHGFLDAALLLPLTIGYGFFMRGLWRGAIGYPPDNWIERLLAR